MTASTIGKRIHGLNVKVDAVSFENSRLEFGWHTPKTMKLGSFDEGYQPQNISSHHNKHTPHLYSVDFKANQSGR
jgi:hypothetical protein